MGTAADREHVKARRFPFANHVALDVADHLQRLRENMSDLDILIGIVPEQRDRVAAFFARNPRPSKPPEIA